MEHFSSPNEETTSENPSASTYRGGIELSLQNISNSSSGSSVSVNWAWAVSGIGDDDDDVSDILIHNLILSSKILQ